MKKYVIAMMLSAVLHFVVSGYFLLQSWENGWVLQPLLFVFGLVMSSWVFTVYFTCKAMDAV